MPMIHLYIYNTNTHGDDLQAEKTLSRSWRIIISLYRLIVICFIIYYFFLKCAIRRSA